MDINTSRGRETLQQVADAINIWRNNMSKVFYIHTPHKKPADIDGVLISNGMLKGIVEIKCRVSMTVDAFFDTYNAEWLLTFDKVTRCMKVADALQVPFIGFLYFPHDKTLLWKTIYDPSDGLMCRMRVERTETQKTINGGSISRDNAYIDMDGAKVLR